MASTSSSATYGEPVLKEKVAETLRGMIRSGKIRGGQRIEQAVIAKEIKVSIAKVREAIGVIERQGYVDWVSGMGAFCKRYTVRDLRDCMEVRKPLEVLAVGLAAENATSELVRKLQLLNDQMHKYLRDEGGNSYTQEFEPELISTHISFHQAIVQASGNQYLIGILNDKHIIVDLLNLIGFSKLSSPIVKKINEKFMRDSETDNRQFEGCRSRHAALIEAIESGKTAAEGVMALHLDYDKWFDQLEEIYGDEPLY